ncbi:hypothetical protein A0U89_09640 [Kozakia baliensis]|uniref:DUF58 domain-containing protein n=1 Tax=Kozakia baliensis TaxID=153496 RepID=A0A1D8UUN2_9PROT|nr:hypothetical protein A0U89_09640 [Kozakia baliensis]
MNVAGFFNRWRAKTTPRTAPHVPPVSQAEGLLPPLVVEAERIARQLMMGVHRQRRAGAGEDFWQYRQAMPHEPAHRIDWRQSARGDQLWVRQREAEGTQQLALWCDPSASMDWRSNDNLPTKRQRAMLCTLALAGATLHGGERVGLLTGPEAGRHFAGAYSLPRLAQGLAASMADTPPQSDLLRAHGQLVIVSDFLWPLERLEAVLRDVAARPARVQLLCVLDPAECDLPYRGRIRFESLEQDDALTLPTVEELAPAYHAAMTSHLDTLRTMARAYRAELTLHMTDHAPLPALLALYARLSGGKMPS